MPIIYMQGMIFLGCGHHYVANYSSAFKGTFLFTYKYYFLSPFTPTEMDA